LILLAANLLWKDARYPMAAVFPFDVEVCDSPQGHGYSELRVDRPNPFFPVGLSLRGHEFHYSRIAPGGEALSTACIVERGTGCLDRRDFVMTNNVVAAYTHLHALASPEWTSGMVNAARHFKS
jgi:cobyrinic acid a,c-diamide synthase